MTGSGRRPWWLWAIAAVVGLGLAALLHAGLLASIALVADVARAEPDRYRRALAALARLEIDSRGGAVLSGERGPLANMEEDTVAQRAIEAVAGG